MDIGRIGFVWQVRRAVEADTTVQFLLSTEDFRVGKNANRHIVELHAGPLTASFKQASTAPSAYHSWPQ